MSRNTLNKRVTDAVLAWRRTGRLNMDDAAAELGMTAATLHGRLYGGRRWAVDELERLAAAGVDLAAAGVDVGPPWVPAHGEAWAALASLAWTQDPPPRRRPPAGGRLRTEARP